MKMFLIQGDYLKLVLQGSYMSNADKIKLSGPNKEKFLQDIKVRNWMIERYLLSTCRLSKYSMNFLVIHVSVSGNGLSTSTANYACL